MIRYIPDYLQTSSDNSDKETFNKKYSKRILLKMMYFSNLYVIIFKYIFISFLREQYIDNIDIFE